MLSSNEMRPPPLVQEARYPAGPTIALIPAFNEARFIGSLVLTVRPLVDQVVVVDDGSCDPTPEIARRAGATVIRHTRNHGKAAAVNTGFAHARALKPAALVLLDGDGQHLAQDIERVLRPVFDGTADVVVGSRFLAVKSRIPIYRQLGQHGLTLVTNFASGVRLSDSQSGFRAFSALALDALCFSAPGFALESEMQFRVREHKLRVAEVPINVVYAEQAKRNPVRHGLQVVRGVAWLTGQLRPLLCFGLLGLLCFTAGAFLGLALAETYPPPRRMPIGYALLADLLRGAGMLLGAAGVVLHFTHAMLLDMRRDLLERFAARSDWTNSGDRQR